MTDDAKPGGTKAGRAPGPGGPAASRRQRPAGPIPPGPAPQTASLREAALAHLARFAATRAVLVRVLDRRILRWSRRALDFGVDPDQVAARMAEAKQAARAVAAALVAAGVLDDASFAAARTRSLSRGGRSRRAIGAHLAQRGVAPDLVESALEQAAGSDLASALLQARRRRIGPFGPPGALDDPAARPKALGALARAGFDRDTAERALDADPEEAERIVLARHAL